MIWGLMKWNDQSVQETEYLQHYYLYSYSEPEANGPFGNFAQGWKSLVAFQIVFQIHHIEQQKAA